MRVFFEDKFLAIHSPPLWACYLGNKWYQSQVSSRKRPHDLKSNDKWQLKDMLKKGKDFKRPEGKEVKKAEPISYECKKPGHIKAECPMLKKTEFKKKDNVKKFKRYKKKAMAAVWNNESDSDSKSSSSEEEEETANLAFMANTDDKILIA
ncbi:hypothetical protein Taro_016580 [Colocasia esculenta]|uniref:CCHC-type domain-containing protein n=1 Tax=Colocasia esculenta TaxID=4460 RepID=A0A843UNW4_COLES|nr:hypothetical protein [Colocasia esculenta]